MDVNGSEVAVKEKVGLESGKAVAGTENKNVVGGGGLGGSGVWGRLRGEVGVEVGVSDVDAVTSAPVAKEARLNVVGGEGTV